MRKYGFSAQALQAVVVYMIYEVCEQSLMTHSKRGIQGEAQGLIAHAAGMRQCALALPHSWLSISFILLYDVIYPGLLAKSQDTPSMRVEYDPWQTGKDSANEQLGQGGPAGAERKRKRCCAGCTRVRGDHFAKVEECDGPLLQPC